MFKIVHKRVLNPSVVLMDIHAPFIAKKAMAGQFIIFRIDEKGERVSDDSLAMTEKWAP